MKVRLIRSLLLLLGPSLVVSMHACPTHLGRMHPQEARFMKNKLFKQKTPHSAQYHKLTALIDKLNKRGTANSL